MDNPQERWLGALCSMMNMTSYRISACYTNENLKMRILENLLNGKINKCNFASLKLLIPNANRPDGQLRGLFQKPLIIL